MNTLRSPIVGHAAAAARAAVDRHELAEDVALADDEPRLLAAELQVLRHQADRRERDRSRCRRRSRSSRRSTADAPIRQFAPIRTCAPIDGVRTDRRARADLRAAGGRSPSDRSRSRRRTSAEQQLGLGDDLIADVRRGLRARQRRAPPAERDFQPQPVARHDLPAELGVVHAAQVDARVGRRAARAAAAGSPPPATATRSSARRASAARRENGPGRIPR